MVDEKGEGIMGGNVMVEGRRKGMIRDLEGKLCLECGVGCRVKGS